MRIFRVCSALVVVAVLPHSAFSAIRPSFSLDYSSWHATDVVLVVTTSADGTFDVIESWKGDLHAGERVVIPELRPNANAVPISRYPKSWPFHGEVSEQIPREPVSSRMILFLTRAGEKITTDGTQKRHRWIPSDLMESMKASVIWIDEGGLYCFEQPSNPGPTVLAPSGYSEGDVRDRVAEITRIQQSITATLAIADGSERAER